jgi:hypothetical protein
MAAKKKAPAKKKAAAKRASAKKKAPGPVTHAHLKALHPELRASLAFQPGVPLGLCWYTPQGGGAPLCANGVSQDYCEKGLKGKWIEGQTC